MWKNSIEKLVEKVWWKNVVEKLVEKPGWKNCVEKLSARLIEQFLGKFGGKVYSVHCSGFCTVQYSKVVLLSLLREPRVSQFGEWNL